MLHPESHQMTFGIRLLQYDTHPYIPYTVVSVLMVGSSLCFLKLRETNEQALEDVLPAAKVKASKTRQLSLAVADSVL